MEGIILPTFAKKGDLLKKIGTLFRKVSVRLCGLASHDVNIKVALSSQHFNIIELVFVA